MDQNKFLNAYIDNTHNTLQEAIKNSIGLATQKQMLEERVEELVKLVTDGEERTKLLVENVQNLTNENNMLKAQMEELKADEEGKEHLETFKNALSEARSKINELEKEILRLKKKSEKTESE